MDGLFFVIIFGGIFSLLGFVFLTVGILMLKNKKKKELNCTSQTYAKVIDLIKRENNNNYDGYYSTSWHPVIEYTIGTQKIVKESPYGNYKPKYEIGQDVELFYNPENYNEYYIKGDNILELVGTIFATVGVILIMIGIAFGAMFGLSL